MAGQYRLAPPKAPDGFMTRDQVAESFGVTPSTVQSYEKRGLRRAEEKLGKRVLYEIKHVKEFRRKHLRRVED